MEKENEIRNDPIYLQIMEAVHHLQSQYITVKFGPWNVHYNNGKWRLYSGERKCCPLGALLLFKQPIKESSFNIVEASSLLGITPKEASDIVAGMGSNVYTGWIERDQSRFVLIGVLVSQDIENEHRGSRR